MFENIRSTIIGNLPARLSILRDHHILLFLLIKGQLSEHVWLLDKDVAHVPGQLVYLLCILRELPFLLLLWTVYSLAVEVFIFIRLLQLLYLLDMVHHPVPVAFLLLPLCLALALNSLRAFHMAQTVKLKLHSYGERLFYGLAALDFVALEGHDDLLNVQLKIWVEKVGMIVDPCQFLRPAPRILEDLNKDVSHQWLFKQLRMLTGVEFSQQIVIVSRLFDAEEVFVMQSCLADRY